MKSGKDQSISSSGEGEDLKPGKYLMSSVLWLFVHSLCLQGERPIESMGKWPPVEYSEQVKSETGTNEKPHQESVSFYDQEWEKCFEEGDRHYDGFTSPNRFYHSGMSHLIIGTS